MGCNLGYRQSLPHRAAVRRHTSSFALCLSFQPCEVRSDSLLPRVPGRPMRRAQSSLGSAEAALSFLPHFLQWAFSRVRQLPSLALELLLASLQGSRGLTGEFRPLKHWPVSRSAAVYCSEPNGLHHREESPLPGGCACLKGMTSKPPPTPAPTGPQVPLVITCSVASVAESKLPQSGLIHSRPPRDPFIFNFFF